MIPGALPAGPPGQMPPSGYGPPTPSYGASHTGAMHQLVPGFTEMVPGTNTHKLHNMFVEPLPHLPEDAPIARYMYKQPASIASSHAYGDQTHCVINWTDPASCIEAHSEWMYSKERDSAHQLELKQPMVAEPGQINTLLNLPRGRTQGGAEFWDEVRNADTQMNLTEANVTPGSCGSLQPLPYGPEKMWYNTYVYVQAAEKMSAPVEFQERFYEAPRSKREEHELRMKYGHNVPYHNQVFVDAWRKQRHEAFLEMKARKDLEDKLIRDSIISGEAITDTSYNDAYSGQHLVSVAGHLVERDDIDTAFKIEHTWKDSLNAWIHGWDYDNIRTPWPFSPPQRNKQVSQSAYNYFDRDQYANPYIKRDEDFEFVELENSYADPAMLDSSKRKHAILSGDWLEDVGYGQSVHPRDHPASGLVGSPGYAAKPDKPLEPSLRGTHGQ